MDGWLVHIVDLTYRQRKYPPALRINQMVCCFIDPGPDIKDTQMC